MQGISVMLELNAGLTSVLKPLLVNSRIPISCTFLQVAIHLPQSMHLLVSLTIEGEKLSIVGVLLTPSYETSLIPRSSVNFCSSQDPFLSQTRHSLLWFARISSTTIFLASLTRFVFVFTTIPSETGVVHAVNRALALSTSTTQTLQAPISLTPSR